MLPAKYLNGNAVLAIPAYAVIKDELKDEAKMDNRQARRAKSKNNIEAKLDTNSLELCVR